MHGKYISTSFKGATDLDCTGTVMPYLLCSKNDESVSPITTFVDFDTSGVGNVYTMFTCVNKARQGLPMAANVAALCVTKQSMRRILFTADKGLMMDISVLLFSIK
jgi:hypothetical protein